MYVESIRPYEEEDTCMKYNVHMYEEEDTCMWSLSDRMRRRIHV